jgi:hypothetical protein
MSSWVGLELGHIGSNIIVDVEAIKIDFAL